MLDVIGRISVRAERNYDVGGGGSIYVLFSKLHQKGTARTTASPAFAPYSYLVFLISANIASNTLLALSVWRYLVGAASYRRTCFKASSNS